MSRRKIPGPRLVRAWRQSQHPRVSQAELGRRVGCDGSSIRHYELDSKPVISLELGIALSRETGISIDLLLPEERLREVEQAAALIQRSAESAAGEGAA